MLPPRADVHLFGMTDRPRRARKPLVASTLVLRTLATAITLSSFGGMTIFASENLYTSNAPLQPAADDSADDGHGIAHDGTYIGDKHEHHGADADQAVLAAP